jgi:hypothetical protein
VLKCIETAGNIYSCSRPRQSNAGEKNEHEDITNEHRKMTEREREREREKRQTNKDKNQI